MATTYMVSHPLLLLHRLNSSENTESQTHSIIGRSLFGKKKYLRGGFNRMELWN